MTVTHVMPAPEGTTLNEKLRLTYSFKLWVEYSSRVSSSGSLIWTVKASRKLLSKVRFTPAAQIMSRKRAVCGFAELPNILFRGCQKMKTVKVLFSKQNLILLSIYWILTDLSKCLWWYLRLKCQHFQDSLDWGIIKHSSRKFPFRIAGNEWKMFCQGQEVLFSYNAIKILGKTQANQTPLDKILNHHTHHCRRCGHF